MGRTPLAITALLATLVAACTPQLVSYQPPLDKQGGLHLYLQPLPQEAYRLDFGIAAISAVRDDGSAVELQRSLARLKASELISVQRRLASARLEPGLYKGLTVAIDTANLLGDGDPSALLVPEEPLFIEEEFTIVRKRATTLFLTLSPERLVSAGFRFTPRFSLAGSERQLTSLLGFASDSLNNVVSVFNKNTMEIVDTIATSGSPKGVVIDQRKGWVYVAVADDDAIEGIEVTSGEILARIDLNFGDRPEEISLSADGRTLVSANLGSNTISIVDTTLMREVGRVGVPTGATSVVVAPSGSRAYVLDSLSSTLSVLDLSRRELAATQTLEETPLRGAVSGDGSRLFVITRDSPNLLVIDPATLTIRARVFVGVDAASIKADVKASLLYVGKTTGEIVVIDPSSLMFVDTFRSSGNAAFLAIDNDQNSLFVASSNTRTIQKIDLGSKRPVGSIEVQGGSYAVALMGER